jgi:hypothetical protein
VVRKLSIELARGVASGRVLRPDSAKKTSKKSLQKKKKKNLILKQNKRHANA